MAKAPTTGRSRSGSSLTAKASSIALVGTDDPRAETEAVRGVLQAAAGLPMAERLPAILKVCLPAFEEAEDHIATPEEMADPTPRNGPHVHPSEGWYLAEVATHLRKALRGADEQMRQTLWLAFRAGEFWRESNLEGPGRRLDRAAVQGESARMHGAAAGRTAKADAEARYAPALAEAERRWRDGSTASAVKMTADLRRLPAFRDLGASALRQRLGPLRKKVDRDHSASGS